jgi:hypothetical protein
VSEVYELLAALNAKHPDPKALGNAAIQGMLTFLGDYWAQYYPPGEVAGFLDSVKGVEAGKDLQTVEGRVLAPGVGRVAGGATGLVLDLRGNLGGVLDSCYGIADRFVPDGYPMVMLARVTGPEVIRARSRGGYAPLPGVPFAAGGVYLYPLAVLVDACTASAAEVLALVLRDGAGARIFGAPTYGKGWVQSICRLSSGAAVKFSTASWRSGLGYDVAEKGVVPDETIGAAEVPGPPPTFIPVTTLWVFRRGAFGTDVVNLQLRMAQLGFDPGPADGVFGPKTETMLRRFQAAASLPETGVTDAATVAALNRSQPGDGQAPAGGVRAVALAVTGDPVLDRAIQWLLGPA